MTKKDLNHKSEKCIFTDLFHRRNIRNQKVFSHSSQPYRSNKKIDTLSLMSSEVNWKDAYKAALTIPISSATIWDLTPVALPKFEKIGTWEDRFYLIANGWFHWINFSGEIEKVCPTLMKKPGTMLSSSQKKFLYCYYSRIKFHPEEGDIPSYDTGLKTVVDQTNCTGLWIYQESFRRMDPETFEMRDGYIFTNHQKEIETVKFPQYFFRDRAFYHFEGLDNKYVGRWHFCVGCGTIVCRDLENMGPRETGYLSQFGFFGLNLPVEVIRIGWAVVNKSTVYWLFRDRVRGWLIAKRRLGT